jgi:nucleoside-diphosphate-sugar epimerase
MSRFTIAPKAKLDSAFSGGLSAADFTRIATKGFDDPQNAYCHAMAYYRDHLYVGTTRHSMALLKLFPPTDPPAMDPWPVKVPGSVEELDLRGQIWRWDPARREWEKIYTSPLIIGRNGKEVPRDLGYRGMAVFQGRSDPEPALYVGAMSTVLRGTAAHILRSVDGTNFSPVSEPGLGDANISTFRSLMAFDHHLYVPPTGEGITFNSNRASALLRSADPGKGHWELACAAGFEDPTNNGVFEMTVFNGHLYAGTFNYYQGYQIWKTPATGSAPCQWSKVVERGAYRGRLNEIAMSMCPFNGALYVGSGIQNGGYDRYNMVGPAAGEIIRIYPDDSWELVVGRPRRTIVGMKYPLSGMGPGFDNIFAGYIWRMAVHEGWLYASTFDWSVFLPYARRPSLAARRMMRRLGVDRIIRQGGGFELWRTQDGVNWIPVTKNGLGNPYNYGARTLVSTPHGLFLGTANPFGPDVAAKLATDWIYIPNPNGGAEVWLGRVPNQLKEHVSWNAAEPHTARKNRDTQPPILLTGATGFIGSHLLERLLAQGDSVRVFDLPEAMAKLQPSNRVEMVVGSLTDEARLTEAARGVETVYHLAALTPGSLHKELIKVNVHGTENLLRACGRVGSVQRFVFTSSVAVYGGPFRPREWPFTELSPLRPGGSEKLRDYGQSKVAAESLVQRYAKDFGFEYTILRPSRCYGPGDKFIKDLIQRVLNDPGSGYGPTARLAMQILHVRDLAELIAQAGIHREATNEIFNVAGIEGQSYRYLAGLIRQLRGLGSWTMYTPDRSRTWQRYVLRYDVTKAQQKLGFIPRVTLQEGLVELVPAINARG